ncbi:MAG: CHASE2 domain-containing protein [Treponemataceae bacterium]
MKKNRLVRLVAPAVLGILFACLAFTKTFSAAEGALFDALLLQRPAPVPSRRILLLEADAAAIAEAGKLPWNRETLADGLLILTEMEADAVVFDTAMENETVRERGARDELRIAFDREFDLLKNNVKTLFDAIRLGSVRPKDSTTFVDEILSLADAGKSRLLDAAGNRERKREIRFEKAERAFGRVYHAEQPLESDNALVRKTFARLGLAESQDPLGYSLLASVREGMGNPSIEKSIKGVLLRGVVIAGKEKHDIEIPLDQQGAILLEMPRGSGDSDFRRLSYDTLLRYSRMETELVTELKAMERAGFLSDSGKDLSPAAIYTYAAGVDLEKSTKEWRALRERFYLSASRFLDGDAEQKITAGYDKLLESPTLTPEGKMSLLGLKSAAANSFSRSRTQLHELVELRKTLKNNLESSICIVAPALRAPISRVKAAAALGDAILSERSLRVFPSGAIFAVSASLAFALSTIVALLAPVAAFVVGSVVTILAASGAAALLIFLGAWFNPLLVAGSAATVTAVSTFLVWNERGERRRATLRAFEPRLSAESLKRLSASHDPRLLEGEKREASIIAVRAKGISDYPTSSDPREIVSAFRLYHEVIGEILKKQGALLYALEGELIFASFGAPLPLADHRRQAALAAVAVIDAEDELKRLFAETGITLRTGILRVGADSGVCDFGETGLSGFSGYAAFGPVPVRARLLSGLGERYGCRILVTEDVKRELGDGFEALRLDKLVTKADGSEEYFYELCGMDSDTDVTE